MQSFEIGNNFQDQKQKLRRVEISEMFNKSISLNLKTNICMAIGHSIRLIDQVCNFIPNNP